MVERLERGAARRRSTRLARAGRDAGSLSALYVAATARRRVIERLARLPAATVSRETFEKLECYVALLREENARQNLVSAATLEHVWDRHILDSAQLVRYEPQLGASWIDIGSGAGLPGIVIACLVEGPVTLVEPRRLRAEFLHKVQRIARTRTVKVSAKAERVGELRRDHGACRRAPHVSCSRYPHICPQEKPFGRFRRDECLFELVEAQRAWQGDFRVEPMSPTRISYIVVGDRGEGERR